MRRCLRQAALGLVVVAIAVASTAVASAGVVPGYPHSYRCGTFKSGGDRFRATVLKGHVRCQTARRVLRDFFNGKGKMHGPSSGPAYLQYWTLDGGWKCGHGAGGGACIRGGATSHTAPNFIEGDVVP